MLVYQRVTTLTTVQLEKTSAAKNIGCLAIASYEDTCEMLGCLREPQDGMEKLMFL